MLSDGHPRRAARRRPAAAERRRALGLLLAAVLRRRRDDAQRHRRGHAGLRSSGPTSSACCGRATCPWTQAVEEILRWTTPSPSKRRTATVACELGGRRDRAGTEGRRLGGLGQPRRTTLRPSRTRSASGVTRTRIWPSATASTSASARTWPASRSASRSKRSSARSTRSSSPGPSSGPAATATRASDTCPCGSERVGR